MHFLATPGCICGGTSRLRWPEQREDDLLSGRPCHECIARYDRAHAPQPPAGIPLPDGFAGKRGRVLGEARVTSDHAHTLRLVEYLFEGGHGAPYLEVVEHGPHYSGSRLVHLSEAVHALLNLGADELFQVGARTQDYRGTHCCLVPHEPA